MAKSQHQSPVCLYVLFAVLFICQYILIRKVQKVDPIPTKFRVPEVVEKRSSEVSVCLVIPSNLQLLSYINFHVSLWNGCIVAPVSVTAKEEYALEKYKTTSLFPSRVKVPGFRVEMPQYPMNALRNVGSRLCETTHLVFVHPSQIPSRFLYDAILSIPEDILSDPRQVYIIPEFVMKYSAVPCTFWYECDERALFLTSLRKPQLQSCSKWGQCKSSGEGDTGDYLFPGWYSLNPGNFSTTKTCWSNGFIGNLLVKKSEDLPVFDERVVEDTPNSITWVTELYYNGYQFNLLSQGWLLNILTQEEKIEKSTSRLKRPARSSTPGLVNSIHASLQKKATGAKRMPKCI